MVHKEDLDEALRRCGTRKLVVVIDHEPLSLWPGFKVVCKDVSQ